MASQNLSQVRVRNSCRLRIVRFADPQVDNMRWRRRYDDSVRKIGVLADDGEPFITCVVPDFVISPAVTEIENVDIVFAVPQAQSVREAGVN